VRWYQPGGRLTTDQLASQYLTIVLDGIESKPARRGRTKKPA
jgi:hypothetical protein